MSRLERRELAITHIPQKYALSDKDVSIMAALIECRDLMLRVRYATVDYDQCDTWIDEIIEACQVIDSAIAGFVEERLHNWAWHKEDDKEFIDIDWFKDWEDMIED